jgi:hypothetical protein
MAGIIDSLLPAIDSILGVRDSIGAVIKPAYIITRTWYTDEDLSIPATAIDGYARDHREQILPSPQLVDLAAMNRVREGGVYRDGDIILKNVSKNSYDEADFKCDTSAANEQVFVLVGETLYQMMGVKSSYVTMDVHLRPLTDQTGYPDP